MQQLRDNISSTSIIAFILQPFAELHKEIEAITMNRLRERSLAKVILTVITTATFMYLFLHYPFIRDLINNILQNFEISIHLQSITCYCIIAVLSSHIGTYISNFIVKMGCSMIYGDPEFYLTKHRANELAQQLQEQINEPVDVENIFEIVDFCRINYRRKSHTHVGTSKEDWRNSLEKLIYYGDIEHFIDQQQAVKQKQIDMEKKLFALRECAEELDEVHSLNSIRKSPNHSFTKPHLTREIREVTTPTTPKFTYNDSATGISGSTETTPLLLQNTVTRRSYSTNYDHDELQTIARQTVKKFEHKLKQSGDKMKRSKSNIPYYCSQQILEEQTSLSQSIFPGTLIEKLSKHKKLRTASYPINLDNPNSSSCINIIPEPNSTPTPSPTKPSILKAKSRQPLNQLEKSPSEDSCSGSEQSNLFHKQLSTYCIAANESQFSAQSSAKGSDTDLPSISIEVTSRPLTTP